MEKQFKMQDTKIEIQTIKKTQSEYRKWKIRVSEENIGASITNRIQELEKRMSGSEDTIEEEIVSVKENGRAKRFLTLSIQEIWDTMEKSKFKNNSKRRRKRISVQNLENRNNIIKEKFPNLKKDML